MEAIAFGSDLVVRFDRELNKIIYSTSALAPYIKVKQGHFDSLELQAILHDTRKKSPVIRNLAVARGFVVEYVEPLEGNEKVLGLDYRKIGSQWGDVQRTILSQKGTLVGPQELVQGGRGFIYREPVHIGTRYWGMVSTVINIDEIIDAAFKSIKGKVFDFSIRVAHDIGANSNDILFGKTELFSNGTSVLLTADVPNGKWEYAISPEHRLNNSLAVGLQVGGIAGAVILFFAVSYLVRLYQINLSAQDYIDKSQSVFQTIINTTITGVCILDRDGCFKFINKESERIHGFGIKELIGQHFGVMAHPGDLTLGNQIVDDILSHRIDHYEGGFRLQHKHTGDVVWIQIVANKLPALRKSDKDGLLVFFQNISKQKEVENKLLELNASKDVFFSILAHDLRNPFGFLLGITEIMKKDYDLMSDEDRKGQLDNLFETSHRTYKLLENLLTWAMFQSGNLAYNPRRFGLCETVSEVLELHKHMAYSKHIRLTNHIERTQMVCADQYMVETVVRNLVANAIKFTNPNGKIEISAFLSADGKMVTVCVKDTGTGIPSDMLDSMFRIDKIHAKSGLKNRGTGLGLVLCSDFVEKHGGVIWCESQINDGSTFYFTLPSIR
ncbi:MAG: ATP-binding protein [Breznakibacter sp.]